jgi:hypothetical protein
MLRIARNDRTGDALSVFVERHGCGRRSRRMAVADLRDIVEEQMLGM